MDYTLRRIARSKSIRVRVEPSGAVMVTAPQYVPKLMVERFVKQEEAWIKRQQHRVKLRKDVYPTFDWDGRLVSYLGIIYSINSKERVVSSEGNGQLERIIMDKQHIIITPVTGREVDAKKMLVNWLKREGEREILDRLPHWSKTMNLKYGRVRFRQQKSRWGSCSGKGNLSFNWRLIHFKPEVIDYVIVHELAHIKHHNHSAAFWQVVVKYFPTFQKPRQFLKTQILTIL